MKTIAVIPARLEATRFPKKLLQDLGGQPVLYRTYQQVLKTNLFDEVLIATDSILIKEKMFNLGAPVFLSQQLHESGTDRIAEAVANHDANIIVNVQGDEPFIDVEALGKMVNFFKNDQNNTQVCSLMTPIQDLEKLNNPNVVIVVVNQSEKALYFSRSCIPFVRDLNTSIKHFQHIGVYGFRKQALIEFTKLPHSSLEQAEKLEQLRFLEHGMSIQMITTHHQGIGIDTPNDLELARKIWHHIN